MVSRPEEWALWGQGDQGLSVLAPPHPPQLFTLANCPTLASRHLPPIFGKSYSWHCHGRCSTERWRETPRPGCRMTRTPC